MRINKNILGIDASNIRGGGGVTHLVELLKIENIEYYGFSKVILWGGQNTLSLVEDRTWLIKLNHNFLNKSLPFRIIWQLFFIEKDLKKHKCDILFIPGGTYWGKFKPFVTLSQNLLPFEFKELKRYGFSWMGIKMLLLRYSQLKTFKKANAVIFLTNYARKIVTKVTGPLKSTSIISHGIPLRFKQIHPIPQNEGKQYKILYVSIIDVYKHQINVVQAIDRLKKSGYNVSIDLIGPAYKPELKKLLKVIKLLDPQNNFIKYVGNYPYNDLHNKYTMYDVFVYASTCENQPIILLEAMASGLPIASSNFGPMPEVLEDAAQYFNPEDVKSITTAIKEYLDDSQLRYTNARKSLYASNKYSWEICSKKTFEYLYNVLIDTKSTQKNE